MAEIRPKVETLFRDWAAGDVPQKNIGAVENRDRPAIYVVDRPGAQQSVILAGEVAPPRSAADEVAVESMNTIFGGSFTSRINMNLREDKHWSYGAGSFLPDTRAQRPFIAFAPVQTDKTKDSMAEVARELSDYVGARPATEEELAKAKDQLTRTLPGSWETNRRVAGSIAEILRFGLPDDYFSTYPDQVRRLTRSDVAAAARKVLQPDRILWVVIGDRAKIEPGLRELGWGEIGLLDADGRPVAAEAVPAAGAGERPGAAGR
jgi:zinc protease